MDVCRTTLELLSELLHQSSAGMIESKSSFPPTQDKECITFSVLNLLSLQFSAARNEDAESLGLVPGSPLLRALKQRIVDLASTPGIVASVQHAAQATLQAGWVFLLPTAEERAIALCGKLLAMSKVDFEFFYVKTFLSFKFCWDNCMFSLSSFSPPPLTRSASLGWFPRALSTDVARTAFHDGSPRRQPDG